ncbi:ribonuclease H-like domain-containing protein [Candidatus Woesearchaeota archaeon]|nr:ribonuclease H-like domain-containing protein [Candidatus Woesearchaeota archaeon]
MAKKISFYPIDVTYKTVQNKALIYIYGKAADGSQVCVVDEHFEPYFYAIPKKDRDIEAKLKKLKLEGEGHEHPVKRVERARKHFLGRDVEAVKVFTHLPRDVPLVREAIKSWEEIELCTEYDILFRRRYMIDKGILPFTLVQAEGEFINEISKASVFKATSISPSREEFLESPRVLSFDIETYGAEGQAIDMGKNPILMIAFHGEKFRKVICAKQFRAKDESIEFVDSEEHLLRRFKEVVESYKPDILTGYYSDGFDLLYLKTRAEKYRLKLDVGLDFSEVQIERRKDTLCDITGINHLDIFKFIRKTMGTTLDTADLSLNSVSLALLGEKKDQVDLGELSAVWDDHPEKLEPFVAYNQKDAYLTYKLAEKLMPNVLELARITGLLLPDLARMGFAQLVENFILCQAQGHNELAPELPHHDELRKRMQRTYIGGFGTMNCTCCEGKGEVPLEGKKKVWYCQKKKGFLPTVLGDIIARRIRVQDILKLNRTPLLEARSYSLKILANSFYGYLGFSMARWYCFECAQSTSAYGRHYIKTVIGKAQEAGYKVIYSDTDSVFITLGAHSRESAGKFRDSINDTLPKPMELEYEGFYPSGIFVSAKIGKFGAKKKYAMCSETGKLKIRGFETLRRNWSAIAKNTQEEVLNIILKERKPKKALAYVKNVISQLREHKVEVSQVVISTQLTKEIRAYENVGPHVAIADQMKKKGMAVGPGSVISYVVTRGDDRIRDRAKLPGEVSQKDYDAEYYINNQVLPSVDKIFEVLGFSAEELSKNKEQGTLGKFF